MKIRCLNILISTDIYQRASKCSTNLALMKAINIIGIIAAPTLFILAVYYLFETESAYYNSWDYGYGDYYYYGPSRAEMTTEAGLFSLVFTLFFAFSNIINLVRVKTMTTRVMSIIAISLNGILLLINMLILAEPSSASYDEAGPCWMIFAVMMLAFSIVYLVQAIGVSKPERINNDETIDDLDEIV